MVGGVTRSDGCMLLGGRGPRNSRTLWNTLDQWLYLEHRPPKAICYDNDRGVQEAVLLSVYVVAGALRLAFARWPRQDFPLLF